MLADFYIPRLSNDMKLAVQKNHLAGQILYRSLDPSKKRRLLFFLIYLSLILYNFRIYILHLTSWSKTGEEMLYFGYHANLAI